MELPPFEEGYQNFLRNVASGESESSYVSISQAHLEKVAVEDGIDSQEAVDFLNQCITHGLDQKEIEVHAFKWSDGEEVRVIRVLKEID